MRRLVSFVNWHLTFLEAHSEQLATSVASHCFPKKVKSKLIYLIEGSIRRIVMRSPRDFEQEEKNKIDLDFALSTRIARGIFPPLPISPLLCPGHHLARMHWRSSRWRRHLSVARRARRNGVRIVWLERRVI